MAFAGKVMRFGSQPALNKYLLTHKVTSQLNKDTIQKASAVFAHQRLSDAQLRDKVTKVINASHFKNHTEASNAWTDLVSAIEDAGK